MFEFDCTKMVPRFLLRDKNGLAIAKAIEAAMNYMNGIIADGVDCVVDIDKMPEWRLDEMAWEMNCLYDYKADVAFKRQWIKQASSMYALNGTPYGIIQYLNVKFDEASIEEWWEYSADPFHFRVNVTGEDTPDNEAWAVAAVRQAKNVRSILDAIIFNSGASEARILIGANIVGQEISLSSETL